MLFFLDSGGFVTVISIAVAKKSLSALIKRAAEGERIEIGAYGRPQVALVASGDRPRGLQIGALAGRLVVPDDFDAPLSDDLLDDFERGTP